MTALLEPPVEDIAVTGLLTTWETISDFIFAGNATFTLRSINTGVRFTYKVTVKKADRERLEAEERCMQELTKEFGPNHGYVPSIKEEEVPYFINLLRGSDNERDFAYMGVLRKPGVYFWTAASGKVGRQAPAYKALLWFLDAMRCGRLVLGYSLEVWHEGRCGRCSRKLTVPESIKSGYGSECAGRLG